MTVHIPQLQTPRLLLQLKEVTIGDSLSVASMPPHLEQAQTTAFLKAAVCECNIPDPLDWTIPERMMAVCHFMSSVLDDGPNFAVGDNGLRILDYMDFSQSEHIASVPVGEIGGDEWTVKPLLGRDAESIERLQGVFNLSPMAHWLIGCMAAQLARKGNDGTENPKISMDESLKRKMQILTAYPSSDFKALYLAFEEGRAQLVNLMHVVHADGGMIVMPSDKGAGNPPARFPVLTVFPQFVKDLAGQFNELGSGGDEEVEYALPDGPTDDANSGHGSPWMPMDGELGQVGRGPSQA